MSQGEPKKISGVTGVEGKLPLLEENKLFLKWETQVL